MAETSTPPGNEPEHKTPAEEAEALIAELTSPQPAGDDDSAGKAPQSWSSRLFGAFGSGAHFFFNWLITPAAIVLVLHFFVFQAYQVVGSSMEPTLDDADYLIISKLGQSWAKARSHPYMPDRGDVVVFRFPQNPSLTFVKRVIALPGERVVVRDGIITVYNDQQPGGFNPDEGHPISDPITLGSDDRIIPEGHIYVVGDNRSPNGSYDSREWGPLPSNEIVGSAILRLLPVSGIRSLSIPLFTHR